MEIQRYNMFIKSNQRSNGTNEEFNFNLPYAISLKNINNYFKVKVEQICIPFSFKTINASNNIMTFNTNGNINANTTVYVDHGNYDINSLIKAIYTAFNNHVNLTITYDKITSTVQFSSTSILTIGIYPCFIMSMLGIHEHIGVDINNTYTSQNHVNMCPIQAILLRSTNLRQLQYNVESIAQPFDQSDIICRVAIQNINAYIHYDQNTIEVNILDKTITTINLYLTDDNTYDTLNLYSLPWSCTISIREMQATDMTENLISNIGTDTMQPQQQQHEEDQTELLTQLDLYEQQLQTLVSNMNS